MTPRILVVDDDPLVLKAVCRMLSRVTGVDAASTIAEATAKLAASGYVVVISDDRMPDGSGRGLLALVRERYPMCRRLLMSGDDVPSQREVDPTYERFIHKPFTSAEIIALVRLLGADVFVK